MASPSSRDAWTTHASTPTSAPPTRRDDWLDPKVWAKANPNLDVTVSSEYIATEAQRAVQSPAYQNTFRRLHLNQWTQQESRWLDMRAWDACNATLPDLTGRICYAGLDLASTTDIAALVLVFPPEAEDEPTWLLPFFWIPQENLVERSRSDRVPYDAWLRDGLVYATPGTVIDYDAILEQREDSWPASTASARLPSTAGVPRASRRSSPTPASRWWSLGRGTPACRAPTKELLRLVLGRGISHGGNPVLRWMADNVTVEQDAAGNVKPSKGKSREKIDGIVACIMGLDRALRRAARGQCLRRARDCDAVKDWECGSREQRSSRQSGGVVHG